MKIHWFVKVVATALVAGGIAWGAYTNEQITSIKEVNATQTAVQTDILATLQRIDNTLVRMDDRDRSRSPVRIIYREYTNPTKNHPTSKDWWERP